MPKTNRKPNLKNLKPWKKGQSGNPKGPPRKLPKLEDVINNVLGDKEVEKILRAQLKKAFKGNERSADILLDRAYGKAKNTIDVKNNGGMFDTPPPIINVYNTAPPLSSDEKDVDLGKHDGKDK